jgi:hypothetical protein
MLDLEGDGWVFVGASGATYEALTPLGDFVRSTAPERPFARVAASKVALLGVTAAGKLQRSEDHGHSWADLTLSARVADVALLESGHGLLLLAPERLLWTRDHGRTWEPLDEPPFGAIALGANGSEVLVRTVLGQRVFRPTLTPLWGERQASSNAFKTRVKVPIRPSATALSQGRATLSQGAYHELQRDGQRWLIHSGSVDEPLRTRRVPVLNDCAKVHAAAGGGVVYVLCGGAEEGSVTTSLHASDDGGRSWKRLAHKWRADFELLRMVRLATGDLVITGVCTPSETAAGCAPRGVHRFAREPRDAGTEAALELLNVPHLAGVPLAVGIAANGERLFVIGTRAKSDALVVFSADATELEFRAEEVAAVSVARGGTPASASHIVQVVAAGPDDNVAVTLLEKANRHHTLLVVDAAGRLVSLTRPPMEGVLLGAAGAFAVAVEPDTGETWESLDGGASWEPVGVAPTSLCAKHPETREPPEPPTLQAQALRRRRASTPNVCDTPIICARRGCVFGDTFSRVGWRGQDRQGQRPLPPPLPAPPPLATFGTPIACRFDPESNWKTLAGVRAPDASQAVLGQVSWFAFSADWDDASVVMHEAFERPRPTVETVVLFAPVASAGEHALYASLQVEGVAALRQREGAAPVVAWRNLFEGRRTQRGELSRPLSVAVRPTRFAAKLAQPALLSISRGGLFVRLADSSKAAPSYFLEEGRARQLPQMAWPRISGAGQGELINARGAPIAVSMVEAGAAIVRLRHESGEWQRDAISLGLAAPKLFDIRQAFDLAYLGDEPGFHLMFLDGQPSEGWWFPFESGDRPLGVGIDVPTQRALPSEPRTCSVAQQSNTPRVIAPFERGTRHPVMITHTTEPFSGLVTAEAVLFGTPEEPCVGTFQAAAVTSGPNDEVSALVRPGETESSWMFRRASNSAEFDVRRMTCKYDAHLEVPADVTATLDAPATPEH